MTIRLAHRLRMLALRVATENARDYLLSLNLKALQKTVKKGPQDDPRTFYEGLRAQAEKGPLFKREVLDTIGNLHITLEKQEAQWLATQLQATGNEFMKFGDIDGRLVQQLPSLLDYFKAERPDLSKLTIPEAFEKSHVWHQRFKGKEDSAGAYATNKVVKRWDDGFTMVQLSPEDCQVEGDLMGHCVGDYADDVANGNTEIYSLRDPKNRPHVTIEVVPKMVWGKNHKELQYTVEQIQGKENKEPVAKYHRYIDEWLHERDLHDDSTISYMGEDGVQKYVNRAEEMIKSGNAMPDNMRDALEHLAGLHSTSPKILAQLATFNNGRKSGDMIREAVARNEKTPTDVLDQLSKDRNLDVRLRVSKNPNVSFDTLGFLALSGDTDVYHSVMEWNSLPESVLKRIVNHVHKHNTQPYKLQDVARHPEASHELLESILDGPYSNNLGGIGYEMARRDDLGDSLARKLLALPGTKIVALREIARNKSVSEKTRAEAASKLRELGDD